VQILPHSRKTNLREVLLDEAAACLAFSEGLNYAATLAVVPVQDITCRVKTSFHAFPKEYAKGVWQENDWIQKVSVNPRTTSLMCKQKIFES
jgi:hypothetical protein